MERPCLIFPQVLGPVVLLGLFLALLPWGGAAASTGQPEEAGSPASSESSDTVAQEQEKVPVVDAEAQTICLATVLTCLTTEEAPVVDPEAQTDAASRLTMEDGEIDKPDALAISQLRRLEERVRVLRLEGGRYAPELSETLFELGLAYRDAGERAQAAEAFERALYVARATYGLYDLGQLRYLERLVEEYKVLDRQEQVLNTYYMMYWLHQRQYDADDPRLLPAIKQIAQTQVSLGASGATQSYRENFGMVRELLDRSVRIVETQYGPNDPRIVETLYRVAWTNYALALQTGQIASYRQYMAARRGGVVFVNDTSLDPFMWIDQAHRAGLRALDRVEDIFEAEYEKDPASYVHALALIRIHKGDWELLFSSGNGRGEYVQAFEILKHSEEGEALIAALFGEPRLIPAPIVFEGREETASLAAADAPQERVIEVTFDVFDNGRTDHFKTSGVPVELREHASSLMQYLSLQRFRPRVVEGKTEKTRISRRFLVSEEGNFVALDRKYDALDLARYPVQEDKTGIAAGGSR